MSIRVENALRIEESKEHKGTEAIECLGKSNKNYFINKWHREGELRNQQHRTNNEQTNCKYHNNNKLKDCLSVA